MDGWTLGRFFLLLVNVLVGRFDARLLLCADSLEDTEKIGAAVWSGSGVCEMNDGSLATWVGDEWIRASGAYGPKKIGVQALRFGWQVEIMHRVFADLLV